MLKMLMFGFLAAVALISGPSPGRQTPSGDQAKPKQPTKRAVGQDASPVRGFAVAPLVLADEGCARDYSRAFLSEGVELRKKLDDLEKYKCLDTSARGIFAAASTERKNLSADKESVAYFRQVILEYDPERTKTAVGRWVSNPPAQMHYFGWILERDFYPVSPEVFDQMLAQKKIPMFVH